MASGEAVPGKMEMVLEKWVVGKRGVSRNRLSGKKARTLQILTEAAKPNQINFIVNSKNYT